MRPASLPLLLACASAPCSAKLPHLVLILADDLGFGNVGWTRKEFDCETPEVQTPELDKLVSEGIELSRFYVYHMCSPTRSALQTGRLPMHVNMVNADPTIYNASESSGTGAGIPRNMTGVAAKLRAAGYRTHMAGKWDAGMATPTHTPHGRGYESALCYFHHGNSYWKEQTGDMTCPVGVDLYDTAGPAHGLNGSRNVDRRNVSAYEEFLFEQRLLSVIAAHDAAQPLFLFYAAHLVHEPYEVPDQWLDQFSKAGGGPFDNVTAQDNMRMTYHAMAYFLDGVVGNLTGALRAKGMWDDTLLWFFSDNGGPIYAGGNNHPLRGGKYSEFEGGVRVAAFFSGGAVPAALRGTRHAGLGSVADVYVTLCALAGVDPHDDLAERAGLPAVDGVDLSPVLAGGASPRGEVPLMPMKLNDLSALDKYDAAVASGAGPKAHQQCWKVEQCDVLDADLSRHAGVTMNDCCTLCNATAGCAAASWEHPSDGGKNGTCRLKATAEQQVNAKNNMCWFAVGAHAMPVPIIHSQAGIVVGDLKLITGDSVNMAIWTGPRYPNASTPYSGGGKGEKVPGFACSVPQKRGCLFNVSADPSEHHDLAAERPDDFLRLLTRLRAVSQSQFDPKRGDGDQAACAQQARNGNFFGPWLP